MHVWFACIFKALSVFTGGLVSVTLADAVGSQVSEFMRYPVSKGVVAHIASLSMNTLRLGRCVNIALVYPAGTWR